MIFTFILCFLVLCTSVIYLVDDLNISTFKHVMVSSFDKFQKDVDVGVDI